MDAYPCINYSVLTITSVDDWGISPSSADQRTYIIEFCDSLQTAVEESLIFAFLAP